MHRWTQTQRERQVMFDNGLWKMADGDLIAFSEMDDE